MAYGSIPLDKRLKDNIRNYKLSSLIDMEAILELIKAVSKTTGVEVLITERHGEKVIATGKWAGINIDVDENPGVKVRVLDRTVAHIYADYDDVDESLREEAALIVDCVIKSIENMADKTYRSRELAIYVDELEAKLSKESYQAKHGDKTDELTGVLNHSYFDNRIKIIDRSQVVPVAAICININDWKYVNDRYGDEESDRLIATVAGIISDEAKPDYVIGRVDGDVFNVVIPMPADDEAEEYIDRVRRRMDAFEDEHIAPSVAIGLNYKSNVENTMEDALSDAEYAMFENKIEVKNAPGYLDRLHKE